MRQSKLFTKTRKEAPVDEVSKNAQLLTRAGFIHKEMAGVYDYLPLGLRVMEKIKQIIREEMNAISGEEVSLSALQDPEIWQAGDSSPTGSFLPPEFFAASTHVAARFGLHRPLTLIGQVVVDREIDQSFVERSAKNFFLQLQFADAFVFQIFDFNGWHRCPLRIFGVAILKIATRP